jgi:hypothetical protein
MQIRMTDMGTTLIVLSAAFAVAAGGVAGADQGDGAPTRGAALVIDAAEGRDGRDLVDDRLDAVDAEVRLPRTAREARTNVRYLAAQGYDIVVAGPDATKAAAATGIAAERAAGLSDALAVVRR